MPKVVFMEMLSLTSVPNRGYKSPCVPGKPIDRTALLSGTLIHLRH